MILSLCADYGLFFCLRLFSADPVAEEFPNSTEQKSSGNQYRRLCAKYEFCPISHFLPHCCFLCSTRNYPFANFSKLRLPKLYFAASSSACQTLTMA